MSYLTCDEISSGIQLLADEYKEYCELVALPNPSVETRPIFALAIGDHRGANIRTALFVGGLHAREWIPPDALLYLCADLLEARASGTGLGYGGSNISAEEIRQIFANLQLVVLPCANPDGRVYSQTIDPDWRKNRARISQHGEPCVGVDLNRNFDIAWDFETAFAPGVVSASNDPCNKYLYVGPAPASEPETRIVVWLLDQFAEARWFLDVHSAIPAVFHSWGLDDSQSDEPSMNFLNTSHDGQRGVAGDSRY
jgi:murein tripeptide amidase MpaA